MTPRPYIQDGHKLTLLLGPDWSLTPKLICPGEGCRATWASEHDRGDRDLCWLVYIVSEVGSEFLEWWTSRIVATVKEVNFGDGPFEIEWLPGDEDYPDWRPREA